VNREPKYVTNWCQKRDSRWKKKTLQSIIGHFDEHRNRVPAKRSDVEDQLERRISAVSVKREELESRFLNEKDRGQTAR
jgi:hypothetical protein